MNADVLRSYLPLYKEAALLTVRLGALGIALAFLIGLVCAAVLYCKVPVLRTFVRAYIELSRNTPLLIQLFFLYYGLPKLGIRTTPEACGVSGLAFLGGGYMAEAYRSGMEAIAPIQLESALSLGMTQTQALTSVILPQALTVSFPALMANVIFLMKETSVFSAVSLMDLMFTAKDLIGLYYNTTESLFLLVVFDRKEASLCRRWALRCCGRAKILPGSWAGCGWRCESASSPSASVLLQACLWGR